MGLMTTDRGLRAVRVAAFAAVAVFLALPPSPARAYLYDTAGANLVRWNASSPTGIWNDATKTLSWSFNAINFPQANWPTVAQAGAAFQNSYLTIQDTNPLGSSIKFNRLPDTNSVPVANDGKLQMSLAPNPASDYYGTNISGDFAVTYVQSNAVTGALLDADIVFNGGPAFFTWSTSGPPAPGGTNDIEVTSVHEQFHTIGSGHPVYYYSAVWWIGRYPETLMFDRCLGPDDRVLVRTLYPAGTALSTISGTVSLASGGAAVDRAVVVATDANGIPQATVVTNAAGQFAINVPPGTGYTLTAHHGTAISYNADIDFSGATNFTNFNPLVGVDASANIAGRNFTVVAGIPTMTLTRLALSSVANLTNGNATQTLFLGKNTSTGIKLEFTGIVGDGPITAVDFGPGITVTTGATGASNNAGHVVCAVTADVNAGATAGVRNLTALRGTERILVPSFIEVTDVGALSVTPGVQNPAAATLPFSAPDQPLLQIDLAATAVEDLRIRKLRFAIGGSGPAVPNIHLWLDGGSTPGLVDGTDTRLFSGNAYANNPIDETIGVTPPGTVLFDNLALTIPKGTTRTLLLTANMPASGSGTYIASFDPTSAANITVHGTYWGDVCVPAGGIVTGGTQTLGLLAVGGLSQIHTTVPQNVIPIGGATDETQITLLGTVTSSSGTVGMEVEAKPVGTAFTGTGTFSAPTTSASGTSFVIPVTGLVSGTAYHWQARALSSVGGPSAWVSFGANAESETDFSVDTSITGAPNGLQQFEADGTTVIPLGGTARGSVVLQANGGTNGQGLPVRVEIEVQPSGSTFTGVAQYVSGYGATGTPLSVPFSGLTNDYHWQARCATAFGSSSGFVAFDPAAVHFHLDEISTISASAGCIGKASETRDGGGLLWIAAGATLLLLTFLKAGARKTPVALVMLACIGAAAHAEEDRPLPRSLAESPPLEPSPSFMTLDASLGVLFMDMDFKALGTDFVNRQVSGTGTAVLGLEALVDLAPDWRLGLTTEAALWGDIRILAVGPVASWCFSGSPPNATSELGDAQHFLKLGLFYEKLDVTKSNFGSFDASFGARLGYELRLSLGNRWSMSIGAALQYSQWNYSPTILSGDDKIGGFGGLITVGAAWLP
jgi:hypothetical protein